ncbi:9765_t:CDS:2 [Dentiscutata heterogama]|uniref:9765_t:CDS:1 n=1 Tax=Dentiscutata heterogama TaxID=1316150 RepID=A0ACA9LU09_9GLOM|nr:9765_t:CDS:2 [Dentiscutata heterogama]
MCRYDYPFIAFGKLNIPRINLNNNPWNNVLQGNILQDGALQSNCYAIIESRKAELASDSKIFEMLIKIINDNIKNDKLYETYKTLKQPLVAETNTYTKVLNSKKQQKTWKSRRNGKLAFWLL